jgi:hypothetical protein
LADDPDNLIDAMQVRQGVRVNPNSVLEKLNSKFVLKGWDFQFVHIGFPWQSFDNVVVTHKFKVVFGLPFFNMKSLL